MSRDPVVEEIRKFREEFAAQFNYDLHAMAEAIREEERRSGRTFITLVPPPAAGAEVAKGGELEVVAP